MPIGGSFAPPLIQSKVSEYRSIAATANEEVKYHMLKLCDMMDAFSKQGGSSLPAKPHPVDGNIPIVPLEKKQIEALWDHVPWPNECEMIQKVFDGISVDNKKLRDAAFHLLWYAKELTLDRLPLTSDKLNV